MSRTMAMLILYWLSADRLPSFTKIEGTPKHMAAIERWMIVGPVMLGLSFNSPYLTPPVNKLNPRMSRILPMIEPINEYFTISTSPFLMAMMAITNSAALPKVALIMPEKWDPIFSERTSVASPKKWASGTSETEANRKVMTDGRWKCWEMAVI